MALHRLDAAMPAALHRNHILAPGCECRAIELAGLDEILLEHRPGHQRATVVGPAKTAPTKSGGNRSGKVLVAKLERPLEVVLRLL